MRLRNVSSMIFLRYSHTNRHSSAEISFRRKVDIAETDLLEWEAKELAPDVMTLELKLDPFEIKTLLVRFPEEAGT